MVHTSPLEKNSYNLEHDVRLSNKFLDVREGLLQNVKIEDLKIIYKFVFQILRNN